MKILTIDTSTSFGCVGVLDGQQLLAQSAALPFKSQVEKLFPTIEQVLQHAGLSIREVQGVGIGLGPGSFTGLRIGIAAALGFSFALNVPIAGASTLRVFAESARAQHKYVAALIDAKRAEVFGAVYYFGDEVGNKNFCSLLVPEQALSPQAWAKILSELATPPVLVGDGVGLVQAELQKLSYPLPEHILNPMAPEAKALGSLLWQRLQAGGQPREEIVPNYIRKSDAELNYRAKK